MIPVQGVSFRCNDRKAGVLQRRKRTSMMISALSLHVRSLDSVKVRGMKAIVCGAGLGERFRSRNTSAVLRRHGSW